MPDISPSIPVTGQPNSTEEPKIVTALSTLVATVNNLDTANLADGAVTAAKIEAQQAWQTVALSGLSGSLAYYKDSLGFVHFRGDNFSAVSAVAAGATLCTLPAGYRPGNMQVFVLLRSSGVTEFAPLSISAAGLVVLGNTGLSATPHGYTFSAISYRAEN